MSKYTIIGIEVLEKGYALYLGQEIEDGYKPFTRVYKEHIDGLRVSDVVELEFASGKNGLYIKSIRKVVE